jgi:uncharacterized protein YndB with AHSA1/START domain
MATIVTEVEVARTADEVFAYVTDPDHFGEWQANVTGGHLEGGERDVTSRLTVFDPPREWSVRGEDGPIRATVKVSVLPVTPTSSKVRIDLDFEGHGLGKLLVPLVVVPQSRKEMQRNMVRLKANLER